MLRVSRVAPGDPTTESYVGQNRFECLTCPYQFVINKRYYERKYLKKKEVEDILGGKGAWDNVDKTEGAFTSPYTVILGALCLGYSGGRGGFVVQREDERRLGEDEDGGVYADDTDGEQYNAPTRSAVTTRHTGTSCRSAVPTSP